MTHASIYQSINDEELQSRVQAGAMKEAISGAPEFSASSFAVAIKQNPPIATATFMWPVGVEYEAEYFYAVDTDNPNPGGADVITDGNISAVVQEHWPRDPEVAPETGPPVIDNTLPVPPPPTP